MAVYLRHIAISSPDLILIKQVFNSIIPCAGIESKSWQKSKWRIFHVYCNLCSRILRRLVFPAAAAPGTIPHPAASYVAQIVWVRTSLNSSPSSTIPHPAANCVAQIYSKEFSTEMSTSLNTSLTSTTIPQPALTLNIDADIFCRV